MRLRTAIALSENEELLLTSSEIATLVPIDGIVRPPDRRPTSPRARAWPRELGMSSWRRGLRSSPSASLGRELDREHIPVSHQSTSPRWCKDSELRD